MVIAKELKWEKAIVEGKGSREEEEAGQSGRKGKERQWVKAEHEQGGRRNSSEQEERVRKESREWRTRKNEDNWSEESINQKGRLRDSTNRIGRMEWIQRQNSSKGENENRRGQKWGGQQEIGSWEYSEERRTTTNLLCLGC